MATDRLGDLPHKERRRLFRRALVRPLATVVILLGVYFAVPMEGVESLTALGAVLLCLVVVVAVFVWQVRRILAAPYPALQSIEALAVSVPTYLFGFATIYHLVSVGSAGSFSEEMSRIDSLYFTLVCFSTVGFGDIVAKSEAARALVSVQIVGNLVLIAAGVRVVTAAVQEARRRRETEAEGG
ncbi:potassium channel family protein [Rhodococcus triatomae]|nr:hypothetical protein G419_17941 [Rhodococcus triatomae BKS 15-14]